jgi:hypothetical protein
VLICQVWKKLLVSCRGERASIRKRRQRVRNSGENTEHAVSVDSGSSDEELAVEQIDTQVVEALQQLPAKTQLTAVRQMQVSFDLVVIVVCSVLWPRQSLCADVVFK